MGHFPGEIWEDVLFWLYVKVPSVNKGRESTEDNAA